MLETRLTLSFHQTPVYDVMCVCVCVCVQRYFALLSTLNWISHCERYSSSWYSRPPEILLISSHSWTLCFDHRWVGCVLHLYMYWNVQRREVRHDPKTVRGVLFWKLTVSTMLFQCATSCPARPSRFSLTRLRSAAEMRRGCSWWKHEHWLERGRQSQWNLGVGGYILLCGRLGGSHVYQRAWNVYNCVNVFSHKKKRRNAVMIKFVLWYQLWHRRGDIFMFFL